MSGVPPAPSAAPRAATPSSGTAIELRGLRMVYGRGKEAVTAVNDLDLDVRQGEVLGVLGPNGAGKTTTVEICEGLLQPTAGEVTVLGERWGRGALADRQLRARMGVCLQQSFFFEKQRVEEVLELFAAFQTDAKRGGQMGGTSRGQGRGVDEVLQLVSLTEKRRSFCSKMSGGQKQRLAVATALLGSPELLFLDEPTTGLDPQSRRQLWDVVRAFQQDGGTVLLTTHYMDEAEQLCDRVAVVDEGQVIALGTPQELIRSVGGDHVIDVVAPGAAAAWEGDMGALIGGMEEVTSHRVGGDEIHLTVQQVHTVLPALWQGASRAGLEIQDLRTRHASLEDVFVNLTGRRLRDGGES